MTKPYSKPYVPSLQTPQPRSDLLRDSGRVDHRRPSFLLILLCSKLASVPSMGMQVGSELDIFLCNGILPNVWQEEQSKESTEDAQGRSDEEWILTAASRIWSIGLNDGKDVGPHKSTNLPTSCCDSIVLATDSSGRRLGCNKPNVVAWPELTKGQKDANRLLVPTASEVRKDIKLTRIRRRMHQRVKGWPAWHRVQP